MIEELWYRYEGYENPIIFYYKIVKYTRKGVWINSGHEDRNRFVLNNSFKQFACPTLEKAKNSFIKRKQQQIKIMRRKIERCEDALLAIEGKLELIPEVFLLGEENEGKSSNRVR